MMRMFKSSQFLYNYFTKGHQRSLLAKKNIAASFIIKGLNIIVGLILVPLTINYLNQTKYGIWITLSSIITWFGFFDIGLGNGLRNRFAEALATGNKELAKVYVSTTYAIVILIIAFVLVLFYIVNPFLNWNKILNAGQDVALNKELSLLALVVFTFFSFSFVFKLITTILTADQKPAKAAFFDLLSKLIALGLIFILIRNNKGSLLYLGTVLSASPVFVLFLSSLWLFSGQYKAYRPSFKSIDFSRAKGLFNLGIIFFLIQIAAVLLYQTNNIIISQLFGPEQVTPYNVALRYFSVLMMGFSIIITPFWSAFTEAWVKKELAWIRNIMRKLIILWGILLLLGIIMLLCSKWIYGIWVGDKISINFSLSAIIGAWILLNTWNGIFGQFLNGVGKIKIQLILGFIAALLNVPLAIFLGKRLGVEGVLVANLLVLSIGVWIYPLQYYKIVNNKAKGIWNI
jgi:O-antigen/teichoic acid export membrane protein